VIKNAPPVPTVNVMLLPFRMQPLTQLPVIVGALGVGSGKVGLEVGTEVGGNATTTSLVCLVFPPIGSSPGDGS